MDLNRRSKVSAEFSMSSMTDIVFLLLIFFMIASTLVTTSALDLVLPKSDAQSVKRKDVVVNISADKQISVGNTIVNSNELQNEILRQVKDIDEAVLLLRADGAVPYEMVVDVMDIAYRNKLKIIAATDPS
jgi:biopolymer transport protein ExbD|tara:strand:+ start:105 stop:497 length:393 start_codon:yes stop_codon:yes gene_type:complete